MSRLEFRALILYPSLSTDAHRQNQYHFRLVGKNYFHPPIPRIMKQDLSSVYTLRGFRRRLADIDALPQYAVLGVAAGIITGLIILLFRAMIELPLVQLIPGKDFEAFESLPVWTRMALPIAGGAVLGLLYLVIPAHFTKVGVTHVLDRLFRYQGHMPLGNTLVQFFAGAIALISGQSAGREGPAIHLGAAGSSLFGQYLKLPHNSIRILVGCGVAGAISASFNTPLAGVIFSMEVILMEYTIAGFIPVILSAVTANVISRFVYADLPSFIIPPIAMSSLYEIPFLILEGLIIGGLAALFIKLVEVVSRYAPDKIWMKMLLAGACTGLIAIWVPEVMGVGYDTVNSSLSGEIGLTLLIIICISKTVASAASIGLGVPAGLIGPTIFIGATAGGIIGSIGTTILPEYASTPGFYVLMGMCAMMGAALKAPLSALLAVMELSQNPAIILPAMLVIVVANITTIHIFGHQSIFLSIMNNQGMGYQYNPLTIALNRASVASIMERRFITVPHVLKMEELQQIITEDPVWLLVRTSELPSFIISVEELKELLQETEYGLAEIDLSTIAVLRKKVAAIPLQATLSEAMGELNEQRADALYVHQDLKWDKSLAGVLPRTSIESVYQI